MQIDSKKKFLLEYYQKYKVFSLKEIDEIIDHYELLKIESNHLLQKNGRFSPYDYLVVKGILINYVYDYNGNKRVLDFVPEKHWAGGGNRYNSEAVYIKSLEPTELLRIKSDTLDMFNKKVDNFALIEVELLRNAFKAIQLKSLNNISKPTIYNYEKLLQKFPNIENRVQQRYIASYLGVTPQFFSKMKASMPKKKS